MMKPSELMEGSMINWPSAFVIATAMICSAFLMNKPSDASLARHSGGASLSNVIKDGGDFYIVHANGERLRICQLLEQDRSLSRLICAPWTG